MNTIVDFKEGDRLTTNNSGDIIVVSILPRSKVLCRFEDGTEAVFSKGNVLSGSIGNPFKPVTFGVGYRGVGPFKQHKEKSYEYWSKMLQRSYCDEYKKIHPTYQGVKTWDEWHNYQVFAEWVTKRKQYPRFGFNLDKDLIIPGNKLYHPDNCSLVPQHINNLTVRKAARTQNLPQGVTKIDGKYVAKCRYLGVEHYLGYFETQEEASESYRVFKKQIIVDAANRYREDLDDFVYEALLNFEV